jgi:NAD(P)-dependent dehydrogenase (short-subunit alcohol dehydrogenase family)
MSKHWSMDQARDQSGRVAIVTGANTGLGYETALALAGKGAHVILACRNRDKAEAAKQRMLAQQPSAQLEVRELDTASLASVRAFAVSFGRDHPRLDLLVNNAGIMMTPRFLTADGFEGQLGVNHLGHFLLTGLLLPLLGRSGGARVVSLYSVAAKWHGMHFEDLQFERGYDAARAYSQSKMACLMFALELDRRLRAAGQGTRSMAAHPGFSRSELSRHLALPIRAMLAVFGGFILQPSYAGALPSLYAALGENLEGGEAIGPAGRNQTKGPPVVQAPFPGALDQAQRARLWSASEELCGFSYAL